MMKMKNMKKIKILSEDFRENSNKNNYKNIDKKLYEFNVKIANTFLKRLVGLMFKKDANIPLLFEIPKSKNRIRSSIHSCFMRFEIVIVFIGFDNKIFEIVTLKPWQYYAPKKPAQYIIEFEKKEFKKYNLEVKDIVMII